MISSEHVVSLATVASIQLAAVRRAVPTAAVYDAVVGAPIWSLAEARQIPFQRRTVMLYHGPRYRSDNDVVTFDVGIIVSGPFEPDLQLQAVSTPAGEVAEATLVGHYEDLPGVHQAILLWCAANGRTATGTSWEIATWHEDPEQRVTKVQYLLK